MPSELLKNSSKIYLPIKEASKLVSYSRDYVAKLAREQKILAKQEGRQWFIEVDSLKNFAFFSLCEQKIRSNRLSAERKREQQVKKEVEAISLQTKNKLSSIPTKVALRLFGTVLAGLFMGLLFNNTLGAFRNLESQNLFASLDYAVNQIFYLDFPSSPHNNFSDNSPVFVTKNDTNLSDTVVTSNFISSEEYQGILILTATSSPGGQVDVKGLFSDPVEVEMFSDTQGRVILSEEGSNPDRKETEFSLVQIPKPNQVNSNDYEF